MRYARGVDIIGDLMMLTSLACNDTPVLVGRPRDAGGWYVDFSGGPRRPPNTPELFERIAASTQPVEIADLASVFPESPLVAFPSLMRWAYGFALRDEDHDVMAVVVILARCPRTLTRREQRVMNVLARLMNTHLTNSANARGGGIAETSRVRTSWSAARAGRPAAYPPDGHLGILRSREVAALFDVTERTINNWAQTGRLPSFRTAGGHLRFRYQDIESALGHSLNSLSRT